MEKTLTLEEKVRLVAEYMGYVYGQRKVWEPVTYIAKEPVPETYLDNGFYSQMGKGEMENHLSSWNGQIPVWAKINRDWRKVEEWTSEQLTHVRKTKSAFHAAIDQNNPAAALDVLVEAIQELKNMKH